MFREALLLANKYKLYIIIFINALIFVLLIYKDPFSDRTLIPNFEPFPDTIHYINPARSFLMGKGLVIYREGRGISPSVPPLYSLVLVPLFAIFNDPRVFYYSNVLVAFAGFFLFLRIIRKITKDAWITGFILFLYTTNYFFYWYPTLAMAENLILLLFLLGVNILVEQVTFKYAFLAGFITVGFYATKYASAPLTGSFLFLYLIEILIVKKEKKYKTTLIVAFLTSIMIFYLVFLKQSGLLRSIVDIIPDLFFKPMQYFLSFLSGTRVRPVNTTNAAFHQSYFNEHFPRYLQALLGGSARFLWDFTPILPTFAAWGGFCGLLLSLLKKNWRFLGFSLILMLFSSIYFISNFYAFDMRYIYHVIPTLLLGLTLFLSMIRLKIKKTHLIFFYIVLGVFFMVYMFSNAIRLKKQIMLNLKYKETPWYYIAILKLNSYFSRPIRRGTKPVIISAHPPYFIDFFSNGNYGLLPLAPEQEFRRSKETAWGPNDYSDLILLYRKYISQGYDLYVQNSGLGNESHLTGSYRTIKDNFKLELVVAGCYDTCNIYKMLPLN